MKLLILSAALGCSSLCAVFAQESTEAIDPNLEAIQKNAQDFLTAYNAQDVEGLAKQFLPDGEIVFADGTVAAGREAISEFYTELFSAEEDPKGALEADSVRFVTPGVAIEDGTFHVTSPTGEVSSHFYTAVRVKQEDNSWKIASVRDELEDHAPANEKLLDMAWIIGDWLIEADGARTFVTFEWSDDGPYIDGRALTEMAGVESTSSTYRIGWDAVRKSPISWAFDAEGGHNQSIWTKTDSGWLLRSTGFTADGEIITATREIEPDESGQSFLWLTRDHVLDGVAMPDNSTQVVRRPPDPASAETNEGE